MTGRLTRERMLDAFEAQVGLVRFALAGDGSAAGTGGADLAAPVPSCPGWTVHDLVTHLATANWWGGANVREANPESRARGMREILESAPPATEGSEALAGWYADLAAAAARTFADCDPDTQVWTFGGPGRAEYWLRRQLHETVIHRWDLENALGGASAVTPLLEDVALDTVDEFCGAMRPLMALLGEALPATVRVRPTEQDTDLEWVVPGADGSPEVTVRGTPETLALLLWGRVGADAEGADVEVTGDRAAFEAAVEAGFTA